MEFDGSGLAPVLANIILTKQIVDDLIETRIINFYRGYVDDTLVLIKPWNNTFRPERIQ